MRTRPLIVAAAYGSLAALVLACFWLITLVPLRLGWGRELIGAAIAVVAMSVGLQLARRRPSVLPPTAVTLGTDRSASGNAAIDDVAGNGNARAVEPERAAASRIAAGNPATGNPGSGGGSTNDRGADGGTPLTELSAREREVLRWLTEGLSNKEIARMLCLSENTVKTHLANLYAKLGVGRRTEALKAARERGLG